MIATSNESLFINDEQYVLVVDLFIVRPELQLQVTGDCFNIIIITIFVIIIIIIVAVFTNCILLMSCSYAVADCCMQLSAALQPGSSDREQELALVICCLMTLKQAIFTVYTLIFDSICSSSYQKCLSESESVRCTKKNLHRLLYKGQSCTASIETF